MTSDFENKLEKYAEVIVKVGLNLQPGQRLLIGPPFHGILGVPIELAPLVRKIVLKAYQAGASLVDVIWADDQLRLIRFQQANQDSFEEFPAWRSEAAHKIASQGDAILNFFTENPDLLLEQDTESVATYRKTGMKHMKPTNDLRSKNAMNWTVVTAPVEGWTEKVFPDIPPENRTAIFWETIFEICRIKEADPVSAWSDHVADLKKRSDYLNLKKYAALKFKAPGTDLQIGLPKEHVWQSARMKNQAGIDFTANIPTEEIFTIPHKDRIEGVVTTTMPLSFEGVFIEEITLTFSGGKVIKATAKKGEESLHKLLATDDGIKQLGEVALVPHSSPISQIGKIFYNILIDENASSHIALGRAYKFCLSKGESMSQDEFATAGGNDSLAHIDCLIGSKMMDIDGVGEGGEMEPIMREGEWFF
jgi:aminopeptidase